MVTTEDVARELQRIAAFTAEELESYETLIAAAAATVEREEAGEAADALKALVAAARVNYQIALLQSAGDGVSSFKAGEVSISETKSSAVDAAKVFCKAVEAQYSRAACGDGFAFRSVG